MKKLFPTSTAGSLPKPSWLAEPEKLWSPWKLQGEELADGKRDALRLSLHEQQHAGIDIVSDGEQSKTKSRTKKKQRQKTIKKYTKIIKRAKKKANNKY